jgi:hypothetical protein
MYFSFSSQPEVVGGGWVVEMGGVGGWVGGVGGGWWRWIVEEQ